MGADCIFDDKFDVDSKIFILKFSLILRSIRFSETVDNSSCLMSVLNYFGPKLIGIHLQKGYITNLVLPFT